MRISIFEDFGALNSGPVFDAIKQGLNELGIDHDRHDPLADVAVIWSVLWQGRMGANKDIWDFFKDTNKPVIVAEVGLINRGVTWKLSIHHNNVTHFVPPESPNRFKKLNINTKPWRTNGENIMIVTQQSKSEQWIGQPDTNIWIQETVDELRKHTDRPIIIRPHPRQRIKGVACPVVVPRPISGSYDSYDFIDSLTNVWAIVNWSSSPGVESIIHGVPAFVGPKSLAASVANVNLSDIENPLMPDRTQWVNEIAHTEWTLNEIATGYPLQKLLDSVVFHTSAL